MSERKRPKNTADWTAEDWRAAADDVGRAAAALNAKGWPNTYDHEHPHAHAETGTHAHLHRHREGEQHHDPGEHARRS